MIDCIVMSKCTTCGRPNNKEHKCPPKFKVWDFDRSIEKDAKDIFGVDAEEAAETILQKLYSNN